MKNTRKLLVSSLIMILSCCLLFAGTTFAWFSDSVTSGNNIITAGNLDVELYYSFTANADEDWIAVNKDTSILTKADKWEPGFTKVVYFRIKNAGSLDFKYSFNMNIDETPGTNVAGDPFYLSKSLKFGSDFEDAEKLENRNAYVAQATRNLNEKNVLVGQPAKKLEAGKDTFGWLVITMPTSVGNEANAKPGTEAPSIKVSFDLFATQVNSEEDSFGSNYDNIWLGDVDAKWYNTSATEFTLYTAEEFAGFAQLVNEGKDFAGKIVKLGSNVDLNNLPWTPIGSGTYPFNGTFDGNNKTITNVTLSQTYVDSSSFVDGSDYGFANGLFGVIGWADGDHKGEKVTIQNLNLEVSFEADKAYVFGGLVGADAAGHKGPGKNSFLACDIEISNITVNGKVISSNKSGVSVGGIAGKLYTKGNIVIKDCINNAEIKAENVEGKDNKVGGILGYFSGANSVTITNNTNNGNVTSKSARSAGCKAAGICITGATTVGVNISYNTNNGDVTGTEYAVAAIAFSGSDKPIYKMPEYTTVNNINNGQLFTLNYQTFEKTEVLYTFLVYGGKSQTPANNTTDDVKYADGIPVLEINKTISE